MTTFHEELNIEFVEYQEDYVKLKMPLKSSYANPIGSMHGGLIATLVDTAAGLLASAGKYVTPTNNMSLYYLSPVMVKEGEYVYADAKVIKRGKNIIVIESEVYDYEGTLAAKSTISFSVVNFEGSEELVKNIQKYLPN